MKRSLVAAAVASTVLGAGLLAAAAPPAANALVVKRTVAKWASFYGSGCTSARVILYLPRKGRAIRVYAPRRNVRFHDRDTGRFVARLVSVAQTLVRGHQAVIFRARALRAACGRKWRTPQIRFSARAAVRVPVYLPVNCFRRGQRPWFVLLACGDGNTYLKDLSWSAWGGRTATARGTLAVNSCQPYCALGAFKSTPVRVVAYRPTYCLGVHQYSRIRYWSALQSSDIRVWCPSGIG